MIALPVAMLLSLSIVGVVDEDLCVYNEAQGWTCPPEQLAHAKTIHKEKVSGDTPKHFEVRLVPDKKRSCIAAVEITIGDSAEDLVIDWSRVALLANKQAIQAVPSFARSLTTNLAQRPSIVPAGSVLKEVIFPINEKCLGPEHLEFPKYASWEFGLLLPLKKGEENQRIEWKEQYLWGKTTELEAMWAMTPPVVGKKKESWKKFDDGISSAGYNLIYAGLLIGILADVGAAMAYAINLANGRNPESTINAIGTYAGSFACGFLCFSPLTLAIACPPAIGGYYWQGLINRDYSKYLQWVADQKKRTAYDQKLKELQTAIPKTEPQKTSGVQVGDKTAYAF